VSDTTRLRVSENVTNVISGPTLEGEKMPQN